MKIDQPPAVDNVAAGNGSTFRGYHRYDWHLTPSPLVVPWTLVPFRQTSRGQPPWTPPRCISCCRWRMSRRFRAWWSGLTWDGTRRVRSLGKPQPPANVKTMAYEAGNINMPMVIHSFKAEATDIRYSHVVLLIYSHEVKKPEWRTSAWSAANV